MAKKRDFLYGLGERVVVGDGKERAIMLERVPGEETEKGFKLGERFGGEQFPTRYQSYTTGGAPYDEFTAPEHVDEYDLGGS